MYYINIGHILESVAASANRLLNTLLEQLLVVRLKINQSSGKLLAEIWPLLKLVSQNNEVAVVGFALD